MIMIKDLKTEFSNDLEYHDWFYDFSDDHSVWKKGFNARKQLENVASTLVKTKQATPKEVSTLWNFYAPEQYKINEDRFAPKVTQVKVFKNKLTRPSMGQVVKLKKELGISASEANFRLTYGVEPSEFEIKTAKQNQGRFFFHYASHPELWELKNETK
jgi:hypothetical protein